MTTIHLDTDLGGDIDDLCALALLLRWEGVEIAGITTVAEATGRRAGYVRYILGLEGRQDIPVAAGADVAGGFYRHPEPGFPDETRYWPEPVQPSPGALDDALELLKRSIEHGATVIAIGPYTNLSLLERKHPGILQEANLFLMGGYVFPVQPGFPPWDNEMDWNIQVDVRSARCVIERSDPTLVPLSVTSETALRRAYLRDLEEAGALGRLIARQAEAFASDEQNETRYGETCPGLPPDIVNFQHDPLACAIALGWREDVVIEEVPLRLEEKNSWLYERIDPSGRPVRVVRRIDGPRFDRFWLDKILSNAGNTQEEPGAFGC